MNPTPPRIRAISAVVCNYDGEHYLEECLRSLVAQERVDEILVVDNASTDGSVALVHERFPEVTVIRLAENGGPGAARNAGMRAARHRWVLAVDNDAVLTPGMAARLAEALEARPDACVAQPRSVLYEERDRVHYDAGRFHYCGLLSLRNFYLPLAEAEGEGVVETDALIGIAPLLDRDAVLSSGGYDESFFYLAEDFDLALRLRLDGRRLLAVEDALVWHRGGTAGLSFRGGGYPERRAFLHARNRWMLMLKSYRARTLLLAAPGLLLYEVVFTLFALAQGQLRAQLAGKLAALRQAKRLLRERAAIQRRRRVHDRDVLVGGPLTISPSLLGSGAARAAIGMLDAVLRSYWALVRRFAG